MRDWATTAAGLNGASLPPRRGGQAAEQAFRGRSAGRHGSRPASSRLCQRGSVVGQTRSTPVGFCWYSSVRRAFTSSTVPTMT